MEDIRNYKDIKNLSLTPKNIDYNIDSKSFGKGIFDSKIDNISTNSMTTKNITYLHRNLKFNNRNIFINPNEKQRPVTRGFPINKENKFIFKEDSEILNPKSESESKKLIKINITKLSKQSNIKPLSLNNNNKHHYHKIVNYLNPMKRSCDFTSKQHIKISFNKEKEKNSFKGQFNFNHFFSPNHHHPVKLVGSAKEIKPASPININIQNININNYNFPSINIQKRNWTPSIERFPKKKEKSNKKIIDINYVDENNDSFIKELNEILNEVKEEGKDKELEVNVNKFNYNANMANRPMTSYGGLSARKNKLINVQRNKSAKVNI